MHGPVNKLLRATADIKMAGSGHPHSSPLNGDFEEEKHALECTSGKCLFVTNAGCKHARQTDLI